MRGEGGVGKKVARSKEEKEERVSVKKPEKTRVDET